MTKSSKQEERLSDQKNSSEKKVAKDIKIPPNADRAIVELVEELMKIDKYQQDQEEAAYKSFQNGIDYILYHSTLEYRQLERRKQKIMKEIERLLSNGR